MISEIGFLYYTNQIVLIMYRRLMCMAVSYIITTVVLYGQINSLEDIEQWNKTGLKNALRGFFKDFYSFEEPFQMGGGMGINLRSYNANGGPLRQDPFFYSVDANINFKIYHLV